MTPRNAIHPAAAEPDELPQELRAPATRAVADPVAAPDPEAPLTPPVRGEGLLRRLELVFLYLDRGLGRWLPEPFNPFMQTGAVAITALLVALVTGVVLLLWYSPSVHHAYESVAGMEHMPWTAGLMRSLHRYSSDAALFFVLVHAIRVVFERRFTGPRWLPWVTGVLSTGTLWLVGWTGYWLVWDARAQQVAVGTARMLDVVPIFVDPLGRSFLTDAGVNSLLFFVVFFVHMLIPLAMVVLLWIHLVRLSRPRFLTHRPLTVWVVVSLVVVSLVYPATAAEPARMRVIWSGFSMDWWYLVPLALTDRLAGGALWSIILVSGAGLAAFPWYMGRGRRLPARVEARRCNACRQCYEDCPYDAISMVPRTEKPLRYEVQAEVDLARCVGCGVCAGSCDGAAIGLDWLSVPDQRRRLEAWVQEDRERGETPHLALVCAESAGGTIAVDEETGLSPELPGFRVLRLPCAAWTHMLTVERVLRRGAAGVVIAGCGPGDCRSREGDEWLRGRLAGTRNPALRADKVDPGRVLVLTLNRTQRESFAESVRRFRGGEPVPPAPRAPVRLAHAASFVLSLLIVGLVAVGSDLGYAAPRFQGSELVVTFKHPGQLTEHCRDLTEQEKAKLPVHMRRERVCDRRRSPVRLRVHLDGRLAHEASYPPTGIWGDGSSVAVERIRVPEGEHRVTVALGDGPSPEEWTYTDGRALAFEPSVRRVVTFDRSAGFTWH